VATNAFDPTSVFGPFCQRLKIFAVAGFVLLIVLSLTKVSWRVVEVQNGIVVGQGEIIYRLKMSGQCQEDRLNTTLRLTNSFGSTIFETESREFDCNGRGAKSLARTLREWVDKFLKDHNLKFLRETSHKFIDKFLAELKLPTDSP